MERELTKGERPRVAGGKLIIRAGKRIEQVEILEGTAGVCVALRGNHGLSISFEEGTLLGFGCGPKDLSGNYQLYAQKWNNGIGKLSFNGSDYTALPPSANAHLLIEKDALFKLEQSKRTLPGRRIEN